MEKKFQFLINRRNFKADYFIIFSESMNMPMSFDGHQLSYANLHGRSKFHIEIYTKEDAENFIAESNRYRRKNNFSKVKYNMMRVFFPY